MTGLTLVQTTQTWSRVPTGEFWRKCLVRTAAGELRWYLIRDDLLAAA